MPPNYSFAIGIIIGQLFAIAILLGHLIRIATKNMWLMRNIIQDRNRTSPGDKVIRMATGPENIIYRR